MKYLIGRGLLSIGARLWVNGGMTGEERYEDLTMTGKLGFRIFYKGVKLIWGSVEKFHELAEKAAT